MTKNILYTIDTCGPGGAETVFLELLSGIDREAFCPFVLLKGKGWLYDEVVKLGLLPEIIDMRGSFNLRYLSKLIDTVKQKKIHLVHSNLFGSNVYCSLVGLACGVPVVSTFHGAVDSNRNGRMVDLKFRLINMGSSQVVFVSNYLREYYLNHTVVSRRKAITIHNGVDCNRFSASTGRELRRELGYSEEDILIGSIGNVRPSKGYDVLLKAAALVTKELPRCKFVAIGEGHGALFQDLLEMRKKCGLDQVVRFLGFRSDIEKILACLDLFVLPSTTEGFSIATIEAMASGLPVVVTNSGGPREIVTHLKDGLLVEPNCPEGLAEGITRCLTDHELRRSMGAKARNTVEEEFSMKRMLEKYEDLYARTIGGGQN